VQIDDLVLSAQALSLSRSFLATFSVLSQLKSVSLLERLLIGTDGGKTLYDTRLTLKVSPEAELLCVSFYSKF